MWFVVFVLQVEDPSLPNDEGITALHNAVCAGHTEIVKFLVQFGVNVNAADSDGWWVTEISGNISISFYICMPKPFVNDKHECI